MTRGDYFCCAHACLGSYCIYSILVCKNAPFLNLKLILHRIMVEKIKKKKIEKSADVVTQMTSNTPVVCISTSHTYSQSLSLSLSLSLSPLLSLNLSIYLPLSLNLSLSLSIYLSISLSLSLSLSLSRSSRFSSLNIPYILSLRG